jgi:hypothetical protein
LSQLPIFDKLDSTQKDQTINQLCFVSGRRAILGKEAKSTKQNFGTRKLKAEDKQQLALDLYFKQGMKPK